MVETKLQKSGKFSEHDKSIERDKMIDENNNEFTMLRDSENIECVMQQVN